MNTFTIQAQKARLIKALQVSIEAAQLFSELNSEIFHIKDQTILASRGFGILSFDKEFGFFMASDEVSDSEYQLIKEELSISLDLGSFFTCASSDCVPKCTPVDRIIKKGIRSIQCKGCSDGKNCHPILFIPSSIVTHFMSDEVGNSLQDWKPLK